MMSMLCRYYSGFFVPYIEGSLRTLRPVVNRSIGRHIAGCARCSATMGALAATHSMLLDAARQADAEELALAASIEHRSVADRVVHQVTRAQEHAQQRMRVKVRLGLALAAICILSVFFTAPSPAREWVYTRILHVPPAPVVGELPAVPRIHTPFKRHYRYRAQTAARVAPAQRSHAQSAPVYASPPSPPSLGESEPLSSPEPTNIATTGGSPASSSAAADDSPPPAPDLQ